MGTRRTRTTFERSTAGFTLLELMVTVAVAAILMTVAIPAYQGMVQRNTMTSVVNSLVGSINYARSEAVTRGTRVYICASKTPPTCSSNWLKGWIVYAPEAGSTAPTSDNLLRVHDAVTIPRLTANDSNSGTTVFDGSGFAVDGARTITLGSEDSQNITCVIISLSGRVRTETGYFGNDTDGCKEG